jgi:hypothetical protein
MSTRTCTVCGETSQVDLCLSCQLAQAQADARVGEAHAARRAHRLQMWGAIGAVVVAVLFGIGKMAMRQQYRQDLQVANGSPAIDPMVASDPKLAPVIDRLSDFISEACACRDARCMHATEARFDSWQQATKLPADDEIVRAVSRTRSQMSDCYRENVRDDL